MRQLQETLTGMLSPDVLKQIDWSAPAAEIAKVVRNQATSMTQVWDPARGKPKPTPITFETLRLMSHRNEWARAIIKTRKNQIGSIEWDIVPKHKEDKRPETMALCEKAKRLFKHPSIHGSRPNSRSWKTFMGEILEDLLVLDALAVEKERDGWGDIVAMYPVDGATIRPNIDAYGGFHENAYVQMVDGQVTANFGIEDLMYVQDNPMTDVRFSGYGYSPLEHMIVSVTAELYSSKFNSSYFEKGAVPEGFLNLGEDCAPEDVDAFRLYWMNEIVGKPWAIPILAGKGVEWQQWRNSNRDMQFMEYQLWLAKKMCAVYQIAPKEVGLTDDVNRSTSDDQAQVNDSKSIGPILLTIKDAIATEIIGPHGMGYGDLIEFQWVDAAEDELAIDQRYAIRVSAGMANRAEWRDAVNMEPGDDPGLDLFLVAGQLTPLPGPADVAVMGPAAQQQQQQQEQDTMLQAGVMAAPGAAGAAGATPWKASTTPGAQPGSEPGAPSPIPGGPVSKVAEDRAPALTSLENESTDLFDAYSDEMVKELVDILAVAA
jgi:hypothetical protein